MFEDVLVTRWLRNMQFDNKILPISAQIKTETLSALPISWSPNDGTLQGTGCDNLAFQPEYTLQMEELPSRNQLTQLEVEILKVHIATTNPSSWRNCSFDPQGSYLSGRTI